MNIRKATIISVTSVKGGSGKTTNVLNLAGIYSLMKKKTLIIDLDLYSGDIAAMLNIENSKDIYNMFEDMTNNNFKYLNDYVVSYNEYIDVLAAPKDPRYANRVNGNLINVVLNKAENMYDVILIDTNHFLNVTNLVAFDKSDQIVYILNNDSMNLKSMKTMVSIFTNMGKSNYKVFLYEARERNKMYFSEMDIRNVIRRNVDYRISDSFYIKNIDKYIMNGEILTLNKVIKSYKKTMALYKQIAKTLLEQVEHEE